MSASITQRDVLLRKRLEQFTRMLHRLEKGDVHAIHRTRVATRRLRELLPVLQLEAGVAEKLSRRLRKATARLGSVRELDVLMLLINELHESDRYPVDALARVAAAVDRDLEKQRERLMAKAPIAELHRLARKLERVASKVESSGQGGAVRRHPGTRGWQWAADARVVRRAGRLRDAIEEAGAVYLPERLHAIRIAVKKLRYVMEVASDGGAPIAPADLRALKHAQGLLGRLHDLQILVGRARQAQGVPMPPDVVMWRTLGTLVDMLERDCRRLHGRYMRERDALAALSGRLVDRGHAAVRRATA